MKQGAGGETRGSGSAWEYRRISARTGYVDEFLSGIGQVFGRLFMRMLRKGGVLL